MIVGCAFAAGCSSSGDPAGSGGQPTAGNASGGSGAAAGGKATAGSGGEKAGPGGRGNAGAATGGTGAGGSASGGGVAGSSAGGAGGGEPDEYGFTYRRPGEKNLDWLCTFNDGADSGHVYVRLLETGMMSVGLATVPVYTTELAQISIDGQISELSATTYDYGGGHRNDSLAFDYGGKSHRYYHSSFGFGFRSCQHMDCRNVHALGTTTIEIEGCASDRALPEVCVSFEADGTHAPLMDQFMKCNGDTQ